MVGVFTALDLVLFFLFWEVMLVPMYLLIAIWGHEDRAAAAMKFFIFTQASGLLLLFAVIVLAWQAAGAGPLSFSYFDLLAAPLDPRLGFWLMLGFFAAFVVKLPGFPLHSWLPDAHTQAPTAGSVLLAGILLKTGAYGLLRFCLPLFPEASRDFAPVAMLLGVIGILYGAVLAFGQRDVKRLVAYSSVSHMGFVLLGLYAFNALGLQGALMQMVTHGVSTAALFMLAGSLQHGCTRAIWRAWAGSGRRHRAWAPAPCSLPWRPWGCRAWGILLPSSWCSSASSPWRRGWRWPPAWAWWAPPSMPCGWCSAFSTVSRRRILRSPTLTVASWRQCTP